MVTVKAYVHPILGCLTDGENHLELKTEYGAMPITCLARINGEVVGFIANNPAVNAGAVDVTGLDKLTGFICLCDSYNIPMIFLHDTPEHLVGKRAGR